MNGVWGHTIMNGIAKFSWIGFIVWDHLTWAVYHRFDHDTYDR